MCQDKRFGGYVPFCKTNVLRQHIIIMELGCSSACHSRFVACSAPSVGVPYVYMIMSSCK
jgi:hypothetical protein